MSGNTATEPKATSGGGEAEHDCAAMGKMTEQHKRFEPFVGTFKAEVKMWMGPGEPNVSTGVMKNTLTLGGRFLKQDYKGDPNEGPFPNFEGHGFWGYNTVSNEYEGFWIDNACTFMQNDRGAVDASGRTWTMIGEMTDPGSGASMQKKSVIKLKDNDHHSMEMYFTGSDGNESKCMEINYTRA